MRKSLSALLVTCIMCLMCGIVFATTPLFADADTSVGFNFSSDSAGWYKGTNDVEIGRSEADDAMKLTLQTVDGNGPIILSSQTSIDAANKTMNIELKNNSNADKLQFFFATTLNGFTGDQDTVIISITQEDTEYKTYTFDMSTCAKWKGTIVHFRLDIKGNSGSVEMKSMLFSGKTGDEQPSTKPDPVPDPEPLTISEFDFKQGANGWVAGPAATLTEASDGIVCGYTGTSPDAFIVSPALDIPAAKKYMTITLKNESAASAMRLFFAVEFKENINDTNCVSFGITSNSTEFKAYTVDMSRHPSWDGSLLFRLDLNGSDEVSNGTVTIDSINFTETAPEGFDANSIKYDFSSSLAGWCNIHNAEVEQKEGYALFTIKGADPLVCSQPGLGISADYKYIRITLRSDIEAKQMALYFQTDSMGLGAFSEKALCYFKTEKTEDFVTYVFDASECSEWNGFIFMIRFDFNDEIISSGTVAIKSIEFAKTSEPGYQVKEDAPSDGIVYPEDSGNTTPGVESSSGSDNQTEEGGCGSYVSTSLFAYVVLLAGAAVCLKRKKA